jgi:hypothetical protein
MATKKLDANLIKIMKGLEAGTVNPNSLTPRLRKKIVLLIIREDSTVLNSKIATLIGVSEAQVGRIRKAAIRNTTFDVDSEVRELVNVVWLKAQEYQRRAIREGDPGTAWKIFRESIELLQGLGFVFEAPKKIALAHFQSEGDLKNALKGMFDEIGVPTLPDFVARIKLLSGNGGNGKDGGNGNGGNGKGHIIDATVIAAVGAAGSKDCSPPVPPKEAAKN